MEKLVPKGNYGVVMTPFREDGTLDEKLLRQEFLYCNTTNAAGLLLCGSTSEFIYLELDQAKRVYQLGKECVSEEKVLIGGAGGANEHQVMERLIYLADIGYTYAIICPPYYYPQKPDDIYDFYRNISARAPTGLKLMLYNIPFCSPGIPLSILPRLLELENIVGMKDSSGVMLYFTKAVSMAQERRPEFAIFTGQDSTFLPSLTVGGHGCMSALVWMLDTDFSILRLFEENEMKKAGEIQMQLIRLVRLLDHISFPENYRALSGVLGIPMGTPQRSFHGLQGEEYDRWEAAVRNTLRYIQPKEIERRRSFV